MFKVVKDRQFTHKVEVMTPTDGGHELQSFDCRFRVVPSDETEKHDLRSGDGTVAFLKLAIVSFGDDLVGEDGKPMPYNDALRDMMLADYPIRQGLITTYLNAVTKARAKN